MEPVPAPRLPTDLPWLNVGRPLEKEDLLGRVVVLDFWTSCCANCLHTLPVLHRVERALADEPVLFIGVHTPKFDHERSVSWVRDTVRRLGITHPVVVDAERRVWRDWHIEAWPTLMVVSPDGMIYGVASGEPDPEPLEKVIRDVLSAYAARRTTTPAPRPASELPLRPEPARQGTLAFPGKVYATGRGLFVADTAHHQVVALEPTPDGAASEARRFGSGVPGFADGSAETAQLRHPGGMSLDPEGVVLWVADTGNHAIRRIDLVSGEVSTAAGTGERGHGPPPAGLLRARSVHLRSPWDVAWDAERQLLAVAMAGSHQLYLFEPAHEALALLAGSGAEGRSDGAAEESAFAQPSGLAILDDRLYVADAETSAVRVLDFAARTVRTLCGGDLFEFGDRDGRGDAVRLQHPVGIVADPDRGRLLLADTYNHKIKEVRPDGTVRTLYGDGRPLLAAVEGTGPLPVALPATAAADVSMFYAPESVDVDVEAGLLYVADTGNHRIVSIDLVTHAARVVFGG